MKWDGEADQQLLLAILATHPITINHDAVAARIGPDCTPRAVIERLKKLKKMAKDRGFEEDATTPRVPKTPTKANAAKGGASSPVKKKAPTVKKVKAVVKQEAATGLEGETNVSPGAQSDEPPAAIEVSNGNGANGHGHSSSISNGVSLKRSRDDFEGDENDVLSNGDAKKIKEEPLGPVLDEPSHFSNGTYGLELGTTDLDASLALDGDDQTLFYEAAEESALETTDWAHPL